MLKILHLAPLNFAGVPYSFNEMHNVCGDNSRLITYHKNILNFPEDICLNFPLPYNSIVNAWRKRKGTVTREKTTGAAPIFNPHNLFENLYFRYSDWRRQGVVEKTIEDYKLDTYQIMHYDGGLDLFRDSRQAVKWKRQGKKIICCYYGSDFRSRGIIKELDEISDLNITSEYDHLSLKENLHYLFYPYDPSELPQKKINESGTIRIIHSPTNRIYKGTELILDIINKVRKEKKIDFVLLENVPRNVVLEMKSSADICIDQVGGTGGGTGYGKAGLESIAMGIPTVTNMTGEYASWLPENPFVVANNGKELFDILMNLIDNPSLMEKLAIHGMNWVRNYHSYKQVNNQLKDLYKLYQII